MALFERVVVSDEENAHLACNSVLENRALQLLNAPSLDQIRQHFPTLLGTFPTKYPKWSFMKDHSRIAVKRMPTITLNLVEERGGAGL